VTEARHMLCLPDGVDLVRLMPFAEAVYRLHHAEGVIGDSLPGLQAPGVPVPQGLVAGWPSVPGETQALLAYASHSRVPAYLLRNPLPVGRYRRVIAATAGGVHALHLLSLAQALAREWSVPATVLWLQPPSVAGAPETARQRLEILLARSFALEPAIEVLRAGDIVRQLDSVAGPEDLLLIGAPHFGVAAYHYEGALPEQLARIHQGPMAMCLSEPPERLAFREFLWEANICLVNEPIDRLTMITRLTDRLCASGILPADLRQDCIEAAMARERLSSTAVGCQTALPHARLPRFDGVAAALAIAPGGIDFGAERDPPRFIYLMLTSATSYNRYLGALARIARLMVIPARRQALLDATTPTAVMSVLEAEHPAAAKPR